MTIDYELLTTRLVGDARIWLKPIRSGIWFLFHLPIFLGYGIHLSIMIKP